MDLHVFEATYRVPGQQGLRNEKERKKKVSTLCPPSPGILLVCFSLKRSTFQLLMGLANLPASLLLHVEHD